VLSAVSKTALLLPFSNLVISEALKMGLIVYHAMAGKNTIGTASPGNSSGYFISSGRLTEIGYITAQKEMMDKKKLKIIWPFRLNNRIMP
jgi:hypothetical protein